MTPAPPVRTAAQNIVVLISGGGSNLRSLVHVAHKDNWLAKYGARFAAVISNRADAAGLAFAREHGIATHVLAHTNFANRADYDHALADAVAAHQPAWVLLAGFMRVLGADFVNRFPKRIVNIHPSLLPAFAGLHTHQRAMDAGCQFAGATVHLVTPELDAGPILGQVVVPVLPHDSAASLGARVLSQEHILYPRVVARLLQNNVPNSRTTI